MSKVLVSKGKFMAEEPRQVIRVTEEWMWSRSAEGRGGADVEWRSRGEQIQGLVHGS